MKLIALVLSLALSAPAAAHEISAGDLRIIHPHIQVAFSRARTAAGYMAILNEGTTPDQLVGVRVEGHDAMIHESIEENGVAKMVHRPSVDIPADDTVLFEQGGLHVMIMGLTPGEFSEVTEVTGTLIFSRRGEVPVTFMVEPEEQGGAHRHGN